MDPVTTLRIACPHCGTINRVPSPRLGDGPKCGHCRTALFSGAAVEVSEARFDPLLQGTDVPVLVDFWAPWCGPCRMMAPVFAQAASRLEPRVRLVKLNTEDAPAVAARFGIRSIPTLALFRNGREVARQAGALDLNSLLRWVSQHA